MRRYIFWIDGAYKGCAVGLKAAVVWLHALENRGYSRADIIVFDDDGHEVLFNVTW